MVTPTPHGDSGRPICGAKRRADGQPCQRAPMPNGRCYLHGGKTPGGIASASWKHGKYSNALPNRMRADYEASLRDQDLLSLRHGISALDALVLDVIRVLDTGESGSLWAEVQSMKRTYEAASKAGNRIGAQTALEKMFAAIEHGASDARNRAEIAELLDKRRKLGDAERRRLIDMERFVDIATVTNALTVVLVSVRDGADCYITNSADRRAFLTGVDAAVRRALGPAALPGPGE